MAVKFYSDVTKKYYDDEKSALKAEEKLVKEQNDKAARRKEKADKVMEDLRGDEISKRLSAYRSGSSQTALVTNLIEDIINGRTSHFEEAKEWATIRERVKQEVDSEIASCIEEKI